MRTAAQTEPDLVHGAQVRLRHALHAGGYYLLVGATGEVVSLHRLHARVAVIVDGGRLVVRLPREALEPVGSINSRPDACTR